MDGTRFDELTRAFAASVSRRTALKSAAAAFMARAIPTSSLAVQASCDIFANCAPDGSNRCIVLQHIDGSCMCAVRPQAKSEHCTRDPDCTSDAECTNGQYCATGWCSDGLGRCHSGCEAQGQGGVGTCENGTVLCGSRCSDLTSDMWNCGACGHQCAFGGDQVGEICVDSQCVCPPEYTGSCGQDYCTNEQQDWSNCGGCGNQCQSGQLCCSGRCLSREDGERFCEWCGYLGGWPQDCLGNEICDRGLCVLSAEDFDLAVAVVTCASPPMIFEIPPVQDAAELVDLYVLEGCQPNEGTTVEARTSDGRLVDSCETVEGVCTLALSYADLPLDLTPTGLPQGVVADHRTLDAGSESLASGTQISPLVNMGSAEGAEQNSSSESDVLQPTGDLAYAVKNGEHWDIWVYSFDTQQNTQLTGEPNSDQWAPAYSHDGNTLAYLSDQTDGTNQIWLMDPDGGNQRQITDWHGTESIDYVAWSPDDSQLIVTLFGDDRRLAVMPAGGGDLTPLVAPSSSFATTAPGGAMLYTSETGGGTVFFFAYFDDPSNAAIFDLGDAPNISSDGHYGAVQIGDPGGRRILTYGLVMDSPPRPDVPSVGDDSNPVWLTTTNNALAFVSIGSSGETVQIWQMESGLVAPIAIAAHDRVWYLAKRFGSQQPVAPRPTETPPPADALPTLEPLAPEPSSVLGANGFTSARYGYSLTWTDVWEQRPEYYGIQNDGSERIVLWHTGELVATVDLRAGGSVPAELSVCVDDAIDQIRDGDRFEDNVIPYDAPALVPPPGAAGRTAWNFLQRDYLYTYVECRALGNGSGTLRIVYQVTDDAYATVYTDILQLLAAIQTG